MSDSPLDDIIAFGIGRKLFGRNQASGTGDWYARHLEKQEKDRQHRQLLAAMKSRNAPQPAEKSADELVIAPPQNPYEVEARQNRLRSANGKPLITVCGHCEKEVAFQAEDTGTVANCIECSKALLLRHRDDVQAEQNATGLTMFRTEYGEWLCLEKNVATVGLTEARQKQFGGIIYLEVPAVGRAVTAGENCGFVRSDKGRGIIVAPLSGTVIKLNQAVMKDVNLVNTDPESVGWLFQIKTTKTLPDSVPIDVAAPKKLPRPQRTKIPLHKKATQLRQAARGNKSQSAKRKPQKNDAERKTHKQIVAEITAQNRAHYSKRSNQFEDLKEPNDELKVACPHCSGHIAYSIAEYGGKTATCPHCSGQILLPKA